MEAGAVAERVGREEAAEAGVVGAGPHLQEAVSVGHDAEPARIAERIGQQLRLRDGLAERPVVVGADDRPGAVRQLARVTRGVEGEVGGAARPVDPGDEPEAGDEARDELARTVVLRALEGRKNVVTANKALLATHGAELFAAARRAGRTIAFEAAVAGGIPVIATIGQSLTANRIESRL